MKLTPSICSFFFFSFFSFLPYFSLFFISLFTSDLVPSSHTGVPTRGERGGHVHHRKAGAARRLHIGKPLLFFFLFTCQGKVRHYTSLLVLFFFFLVSVKSTFVSSYFFFFSIFKRLFC